MTHQTHPTCPTHPLFRPIVPFLPGVALCVAMAISLSACRKAEPKEEIVAPVRVAPAIKGSPLLIVNADAVLYPRDQANIVPKISAPVARFLVNGGDHVRRAELLAELEARDCPATAQGSGGQ